MLTEEKKEEIKKVVGDSLDRAEANWSGGGYLILEAAKSFEDVGLEAESKPSLIPGYPIVQEKDVVTDEFIAMVVDIRNSSEHLVCATSHKKSMVSGIKRVYFETAALLAAVEKAIIFEEGSVTEYLGDGVKALFQVDVNNRHHSIRAAHRAAKNCVFDVNMTLIDFNL